MKEVFNGMDAPHTEISEATYQAGQRDIRVLLGGRAIDHVTGGVLASAYEESAKGHSHRGSDQGELPPDIQLEGLDPSPYPEISNGGDEGIALQLPKRQWLEELAMSDVLLAA